MIEHRQAQKWSRWKLKRDAERLNGLVDVDAVLRYYLQKREAEVGPDDEFCVYMRSTLPSAAILQFPGRRATTEKE